ncbi:type I restriction endonuclease subunit R [Pseudooctadecabacter jejudonensis]|uniref:Type I restriction enzyme endonuclease subunit n=1 Tax=Pseudooctadecabacter jejudonensis TaxID=1391910 RepID=A0A1Y5TK87_9RHOB|nr:HsdR family type I site-specific deoxyribonuclease [Pseudooctadecabacter jejudonensis]SLN63907.1 Type-1 restriction enzyme R protein [Pseudooctadecabacter jejudonensis]
MTDPKAPDTREEAASKLPALHVLMVMGWSYLSPADANAMRGSERSVLLEPVLREWLGAHRFDFKGQQHPLSESGINQVIKAIAATKLNEGLIAANEVIYKQLTLGITVDEFVGADKTSVTVPLVDWTSVDTNLFHVTEELSVERPASLGRYRPDVVCYVNGLPLVVIEAKRPTSSSSEKSMVAEGISQHLRNQKDQGIQSLYAYSQLLLSISGTDARYGTTGTPAKFWGSWTEEEITEAQMQEVKSTFLKSDQQAALYADKPRWAKDDFERLHSGLVLPTEQDRMIISLLRPDRLLDFTRRFIFYDRGTKKIAARYQQFGGVKAILAQVAKQKPDGSREGGVIWHTTGSGKSNLMVLLTKALLLDPELASSRIIIVTDRVDLEKQLATTFLTGGAFGSVVATKKDGEKAKVQSGRDLAKQIGSGNGRIIFTLLQKFNSATKLPECKNTSDKLIVLVDEGHRSQGGENHERMRQALPNAAFIAFTGTPLLKEDKTRNKFGPILHAYTMQDAVEDGAVTPLVYEERKPIVDINERAVDAWFDQRTMGLSDQQLSDLKQKYATRGQVYKAEARIEIIAWDIAAHFKENFIDRSPGLKAQLATDSKLSAIRYKNALDATGMVTSAVVISAPDSREGHDDTDEAKTPEVQAWWNQNVGNDPEGYENDVIAGFATDGAPDILIVVDKLLTGFDEPRNAVLYIDKHLKSHNLLQAIARVNRLHEAKQFGYLIDYRGILAELDTSIQDYQDLAAQTQNGYDVDDLAGTFSNISTEYKRLPGLHDGLWAIFSAVQNKDDQEQFRRVLVPRVTEDETGHSFDQAQKVREDFYAALTDFGMCLKLALSSRTFFDDGAFNEQTIQRYKRDLRFFTELRIQAKRDAGETVDFSDYEDQIRRMVDKQVIGQEIIDPEGFIRVETLGQDEDPDDWSDDKTRTEADVIKTRLRKTIEQDLIDDPYAQRVFSELLKEAIQAAEAMFDHPGKQYTMFKDLEEQVAARNTPGVPDRFTDHPRAAAYYGALLDQLGVSQHEEETLVEEAMHIDTTVDDAVQTHSINPGSIEAEIRKALLPRYFKFFGGLDDANGMIDQIVGIVRAGANRS